MFQDARPRRGSGPGPRCDGSQRLGAGAWREAILRSVLAAACIGGATPTWSADGAVTVAPPAVPTELAQPLRDPHYGDVLFQFYQAHYFSAVSSLMVSQQFDRVSHHSLEAEVLRGGLLLSYGLHRQAGEIFERLIAQDAPLSVRDRAWYFLAKIRYQRAQFVGASDALARIEGTLAAPLQEERVLLQAQLLLARGDPAAAARVLADVPPQSNAARYARFNLGVALIQAGEGERGRAVLDELGRGRADSEEFRSLRDRANVALGFAALADQKPQLAQAQLERVRLGGPLASKALLGAGWAAIAQEQPQRALVPWLELVERDISDAAALEARIALPYAFAQVGALGQSAQRYNHAIASFERETAALDESMASIRSGALLASLLERNPGPEMGWFWSLQKLPALSYPGHLTPVLARHDFQEAFKNYRDLRFLDGHLKHWLEQLAVFDAMLATRQAAYADRLPQVRARSAELVLTPLGRRRDQLAATVEQGQAAADGVVFANPAQQAALQQLAELRTRLRDERLRGGLVTASAASPAPGAPVDSAASTPAADGTAPPADTAAKDASRELMQLRERVRRVSAALGWQLAQELPDRAWQAHRDLGRIDQQLAQARDRERALAQAQVAEPLRFARLAARIAALRPRLQALIPQVAALSGEQQLALQAIAVDALELQKERLAGYAAQARYAVAQLYDRGTTGQAERLTGPGIPDKASGAAPGPAAPATPAAPAAPPTAPEATRVPRP